MRSCGRVKAVDNSELKLLVVLVVLAGLVGGAWYFRDSIFPPEPEPIVATPGPVAETTTEPSGPLHPLAPAEIPESADRDLVPLPALDDSDGYFLLALTDILGPGIEPVLVNDALIDRFVASVDNLTRSHVAEKIRPVGSLPGSLVADPGEVQGQFFLSADNFQRYDALVALIATADLDETVAMYRRFYPLFQEAYQRLGYPDAYFNDRVVEVIDHLLTAPQPVGPVRLIRPHVLYEFADDELHKLSSGRKLLIRIGPDHAASVKAALQGLRDRIAASQ